MNFNKSFTSKQMKKDSQSTKLRLMETKEEDVVAACTLLPMCLGNKWDI